MNEQIKELIKQMDQAETPTGGGAFTLYDTDLEYFAELIIREYSYDVMDLTAAPEHVAMAARHWGVEL